MSARYRGGLLGQRRRHGKHAIASDSPGLRSRDLTAARPLVMAAQLRTEETEFQSAVARQRIPRAPEADATTAR